MTWIIGLYLVWGVLKILGLVGSANIPNKPMWIYAEKNPIKWVCYFTLSAAVWPFVGRR
jgi:hypothetical protein